MKYIFRVFTYLSIVLFFFHTVSEGQISGISGSKLLVPDAGTVENGKFEFEPAISVYRAYNEFNSHGGRKSLNGFSETSSLDFRITLGVFDGTEIGTSFSTALEGVSIGSKSTLFSVGKISL